MQLSLMSPSFLALSSAAVLLLAMSGGVARHVGFLAINLVFLIGMLLTPWGAASTILFCLLGYVLTRFIIAWPRRLFPCSLGVYVLLFIYLRNYAFLHGILPEAVLTHGRFATVGLSFMFFKIVHVMIEARSGTLGPFGFPTYLNYCLNFTTFMMGPIQRYQDFDSQWSGRAEAISPTYEAHLDAALRILVGLMKAYVIAERLAPYALTESPDLLDVSLPTLLGRIFAFYFYLYFNFAGYCDVVIGLGSLMGVRPPENFDKPFLARNISDFWFRFHRSLTQWLTNYVFSPAFKRALESRAFASRPLGAANLALLLTMLVSGLWHGTTLSFLLFGFTHGVYFVVFRTWETLAARRWGKAWLRKWRTHPLVHLVSVVLTLCAVALSLVFFRLEASRALAVFERLVGL